MFMSINSHMSASVPVRRSLRRVDFEKMDESKSDRVLMCVREVGETK